LYLLPVKGSDTQWYKNVLKNPSIRIDAGGAQSELKVVAVSDATQVKSVIEKFRGKYGTSGVNLYSKLDVAVIVRTRRSCVITPPKSGLKEVSPDRYWETPLWPDGRLTGSYPENGLRRDQW